jgi:rubrerythrin
MSELTADRAGLLACQDLDACIRAMIKMAGLPQSQYDKINVAAFIDQAHEFGDRNNGLLDETIKFLSIAESTHPWLVLRASELLKWVESGEYDEVLKKRRAIVCPYCGNTISATPETCPICGGKH